MQDLPLLSITTFLPLLGVLVLLCMGQGDNRSDFNARSVGLFTSVVTFLVSLALVFGFDVTSGDMQFVEKEPWLSSINAYYTLGVDGVSLPFVILSTFLTPLAILGSWHSIKHRVRDYMIAFLVLETMMVGMFCAMDFVLFYLFFEGVLIPMFLIIGIWGGERKIYAAFKFFLYTFLGSILMLVALVTIYNIIGSTSIIEASQFNFDKNIQIWLWLAFFISFAVKVPMWPVHTWLPDAHVEAPTAGSVILAGVLLKMGGYGFLRFSLPMLPEASIMLANGVFALSIIAVVYTSLVALVQRDMKKLIAYSSIAHMGIVTFGTFTFLKIGIQGAIFQMISHGLVSAAMFLCVGVVYDRMHTREISAYGGLVRNMPYYAFAFMIFTLGSVGLPGTSGFVGELMVLMAAFQVNGPMALFLGSGMILGAAYALWLYRRVVFGEMTKPELSKIIDLTKIEKCVFAPIALAVVFFGINPGPILKISDKAVTKLVAPYNKDRLGATDGMPSLAFMKKTLASIKGIFNDDKLTA